MTFSVFVVCACRHHIPKETEIKFNSFDPDWNETFVFPNICEEEVSKVLYYCLNKMIK